MRTPLAFAAMLLHSASAWADRYGVDEALDGSSPMPAWATLAMMLGMVAWGWHSSVKAKNSELFAERFHLKAIENKLEALRATTEAAALAHAQLIQAVDDYYDGVIDDDDFSAAVEDALGRPPGRRAIGRGAGEA